MKKSDITVIILIISVSLIAAYFIGQAVIGATKQGEAVVEVVDKISPEITKPDPSVFNKDAINPAVPIKIGNSTNQQPFGQ